jgi:hypothetical protein
MITEQILLDPTIVIMASIDEITLRLENKLKEVTEKWKAAYSPAHHSIVRAYYQGQKELLEEMIKQLKEN